MDGRFWFGDFELDVPAGALRRYGQSVALQPKPLAMLVHLLDHRGRIVSKAELLAALWPDVSVSDHALWSALRDLRRALDDTDTAARLIHTVRGSGVQFVGELYAGPRPTTGPARAVATDFVDRADAMDSLRASLAASIGKDIHVSLIAGAAGMGKTRLASELAHEARDQRVETLIGRCVDREGASAFWPWLQILRGLLGSDAAGANAQREHAALPELAWIVPNLALSGAQAEQADLGRAEVRFRFFDAFGLFLRRVSQAHPLLIFIDDLHWADEASLLLLEFLIGALDGARIHLVGAFRDPPRPEPLLARVIAAAARHAGGERIDLAGLRHAAVSQLLESAAATAPAPEVVTAVLKATSGNPLFVAELAKLAAQGQLDVTHTDDALPVPQRVRDVLRWQFERLAPECQRLLQLMCVVGGELELAVLAHAAGESERVVLEQLSRAEAAGFPLVAHAQMTRFAFVHDLVRESIYRDLSLAERTRQHRRIAEALEANTLDERGADVGHIAYHYALGAADGAAEQAVRFGTLAGRQANARMAYEDAVLHYDRALCALPLLGDKDPTRACELLLSQADSAWSTFEDTALVQRRFVAAAEMARAAGRADLLARSALGRSGHGAGNGDVRDMIAVDEVDIALLTEAQLALGTGDTELRALVLARLALAIRYVHEFAEAEALSAEAVRIAEAVGSPSTLAETLRYRHDVLSGPRFARERLVIAKRMLALARSVRSRPLELDGLIFVSRGSFKVMDFATAATTSLASRALASETKHPGSLYRAGMGKVLRHMLAGNFDLAERAAREYYARDHTRHMNARGTFEVQLSTIALMRGDGEAALSVLQGKYERGSRYAWVQCALAHACALAGRDDEARAWFERAAADGYRGLLDNHSSLGCLLHLSEACAALDDRQRATELYDLMLPFEDLIALPLLATVCQGPIAHGLGVLAAALQRWEPARRHYERALEIHEAFKSPPLTAMTQERFGTMLLLRGTVADRERGAALLSSAVEHGSRIGMPHIVRRGDARNTFAGASHR